MSMMLKYPQYKRNYGILAKEFLLFKTLFNLILLHIIVLIIIITGICHVGHTVSCEGSAKPPRQEISGTAYRNHWLSNQNTHKIYYIIILFL